MSPSTPRRPVARRRGELTAHADRPRGSKGPHDGRWYWRVGVGRRRLWSGWASADEIVSQLEALDSEVRRQGCRVIPVSASTTVSTLLDRYADAYAELPRAPKSRDTLRSSIRRLQASGLATLGLRRCTSAAVQQWARSALTRAAHSTVKGDAVTLRAAWRWATGNGLTVPAPAKPDLGRNTTPRPHTPTDGELQNVLAHLRGTAPPWVVLALEIQASTGARIGEVAALTWADVRLLEGRMTLTGKTGRRTTPIRSALVATLREWRATSSSARPRVLPASPKWVATSVGTWLRKACDAVGCEPWTAHGLRRRAVDRLARAGVDVGTAAAILGHSPMVMLTHYRQVSDDDQRRGVDAAALGDVALDRVGADRQLALCADAT